METTSQKVKKPQCTNCGGGGFIPGEFTIKGPDTTKHGMVSGVKYPVAYACNKCEIGIDKHLRLDMPYQV